MSPLEVAIIFEAPTRERIERLTIEDVALKLEQRNADDGDAE